MIRDGWRFHLPKAALLALAMVATPASAQQTHYFVASLPDAPTPPRKIALAPRPVQLTFELQQNGQPLPKATAAVRPWVIEALEATGDFTEVAETPLAGSATLRIQLNLTGNEVLHARGKRGGDVVVELDHYLATMDYSPAPGAAAIHAEVRHGFYASFGAEEVAIAGREIQGGKPALKEMVRETITRGIAALVAAPALAGN